ncbi:hypothetical protein HZA39_03735 [Candidatus Peregrinibacteria bacterium]|nr:hypothetical protein [Candidatus Peregrinibacteria bacterium]
MIRKFFAFILILVFVFVSIPVMILFGLNRTLLNQNFYTGPLINDVYERFMPMFADEFYSQVKRDLGRYLTSEEFVVVFKKSIPVSTFQGILDDLFIQLNGILEGNGKTKIVVKLDPFKSSLKGLGENIFDAVKAKAPECKKGQVPQFNPMPTCVIPGLNTDTYKKAFSREVENSINQAFIIMKPVEVDMTPIIKEMNKLELIQLAIQVLFCSLALFALLIVLVLWKPFSRGMRWLGGAITFVAFEALIIYKIIPILTANLNLGFHDVPQKYLNAIQGSVKFLINSFDKQILYFMIVFVIIGAALVFTGYLLKHTQPRRLA